MCYGQIEVSTKTRIILDHLFINTFLCINNAYWIILLGNLERKTLSCLLEGESLKCLKVRKRKICMSKWYTMCIYIYRLYDKSYINLPGPSKECPLWFLRGVNSHIPLGRFNWHGTPWKVLVHAYIWANRMLHQPKNYTWRNERISICIEYFTTLQVVGCIVTCCHHNLTRCICWSTLGSLLEKGLNC